jgi:hypothetical protein
VKFFIRVIAFAGIVLFSVLLVFLISREAPLLARSSAVRTETTSEYVHERYQRSYFSASDAGELRRLHNEQAAIFIALVISVVAFAASRQRSRR